VNSPKTPEDLVLEKELREIISVAIDALPEKLRLTTLLYYTDGLSYNEIASFQEVPVTTVKGRLYESRKRLKALLAKEVIPMMKDVLKTQAPDKDFTRAVRTTTDLFKLPNDFVVPHGTEFVDEIIRRDEMHVEFGGMRTKAFQYVQMASLAELDDGKIEHIGPDVDDIPPGSQLPLGVVVKAEKSKQGRFELADGGSLFLDEVGDVNPEAQAKLLRVLQEQEFERLGGTKTVAVDVRIIVATNKDLEVEVKSGDFREDLFYRLNVAPIVVPPLRERKEDIPLLAEHFLNHYAQKNHRPVKGILPRTLDLLMRYSWAGNVRELENTIERAVIIARSEQLTPKEMPVNIQSLADELKPPETGVIAGLTLKEVERDLIVKTLEQTDGNRTHAAKILGITRKTLQNKLKEYQID